MEIKFSQTKYWCITSLDGCYKTMYSYNACTHFFFKTKNQIIFLFRCPEMDRLPVSKHFATSQSHVGKMVCKPIKLISQFVLTRNSDRFGPISCLKHFPARSNFRALIKLGHNSRKLKVKLT